MNKSPSSGTKQAGAKSSDISTYFLRRSTAVRSNVGLKAKQKRQTVTTLETLQMTSKNNTIKQTTEVVMERNMIQEQAGEKSKETLPQIKQPQLPSSAEWRDFVKQIPTKQDMQDMASAIVSDIKVEINSIKQKIDQTEGRVTRLEAVQGDVDGRLAYMEESHIWL